MTAGGSAATAADLFRRVNGLLRCFAAGTVVGLLALSSPVRADSAVDSGSLGLAPGDKLTVTVFGQPEISGDLYVDAAGNITLPFIGPLEVKNLTVLECQRLIHDRLADGLLNQPSVSVRLSEPRPFAVLGDVHTPGVYPFRYGSTVKSAVAAAGGFAVVEPLQNVAVSEFILADERVRQLTFQRQALLIRQARIEAARDGLKTFTPPSPSSPEEATDTTEIIAQEKQTFDVQAATLKSQLDLLRSQKPRIQAQIDAYSGQIATAKKQLQLLTQHADEYSRMVKQGLGMSNVEMQLKLNEATQESEVWRLTGEISRLQMDIGELDLKLQEADTAFKQQLAVELREVREKLRDVEVTLPSARSLRLVKLQQAGSLAGGDIAHTITITRTRNSETTVLPATDTMLIEPGDVIDVKKLPPKDLPFPAAAASSIPQSKKGATAQEQPVTAASR
jgi:polysaccharide export outer membrane protein